MKVSYNGVTIDRALTTSWEETVAYDSTGMNMIGSRISMTFEGSVFPREIGAEGTNIALETDSPAPQYYNPPETDSFHFRLNAALRNLQIPRGTLIVYDDVYARAIFQAFPQYDQTGNAPLLTDAQTRNIDVNGGPKPRSVRVLSTTNQFARISFTVEVTKIRCLGGDTEAGGALSPLNPAAGFVVSNRCWTDESIDANFYTTRTFTGRLQITSLTQSVHFYRHLYYPPLEEGFRRESVRFSESEDGLSLNYSVTDRQTRLSAPYPATAFSGNVSYSVNNGADVRLSIQLTMVGRPDAPKKLLVSRALQAVVKKIEAFSRNSNGYQEKFAVSENMGDPPSVTVNVGYRLYADVKGATEGANALADVAQLYAPNIQLIGDPPVFDDVQVGNVLYVYDRARSQTPNPYGYEIYNAYADVDDAEKNDATRNPSSFGFIKALATAPCALLSPRYAQDSDAASEAEGLVSTKVFKDAPDAEYSVEPSNVEKDALDFPLSCYKSDITYFVDQSRVVLPQAKKLVEETKTRDELLEELEEQELQAQNARDYLDALEKGEVEPPQEEEADDAIEEARDAIKKAESKIRDLLSRLNCVRVVQLAQPVPKARVVIEAERFGRLPELPDPDEIVTTTGDDPIVFTPLSVATTLCEPRPARNNDGVSYSVAATYDYAMSRPHKRGDEVWLLQNPTFASKCYYPKTVDEKGDKIDDVEALTVLYDGKQLRHYEEDEESQSKNDSQSSNQPSSPQS